MILFDCELKLEIETVRREGWGESLGLWRENWKWIGRRGRI